MTDGYFLLILKDTFMLGLISTKSDPIMEYHFNSLKTLLNLILTNHFLLPNMNNINHS